MANFCPNCGTKLNPGAKFCPNCGTAVGGERKSAPQPVRSAQPQPQPARTMNATEAFVAAQRSNQAAEQPKKKKGGFFKFLVLALIVGGLGYGCFGEPGWLKPKPKVQDYYYNTRPYQGLDSAEKIETAVLSGTGISAAEVGEDGLTAGSVTADGLTISAAPDAFPAGSTLTASPVSDSVMQSFKNSGAFDVLGQVYDITCDGYDGSFFGDSVTLTVPIPERDRSSFKPESYVFFYTDDSGQTRYLEPDSYDTDAWTMSVRVPHFSEVGSGKTAELETAKRFMKDYTTKIVMEKHNQQEAMTDIAPYVKEKIEAIGLQEQAAKDLIQSTINVLGGRFAKRFSTGEDHDHTADYISTGISFTTGMTRAVMEGDSEGARSSLEGALNSAVMVAWEEMSMTKAVEKAHFFLPEAWARGEALKTEKLVGNAGATARMIACLQEGDREGAAKELGEILQSVHPAAELGTKATRYVATCVNTEFIEWKKNEMEELYQIYKNGARDFWGNEVEPQNRESFNEYLQYGHGLVKKRIVSRLYTLDEIEKICKKYGMSLEDYQENQDQFLSRIEGTIMDYFEKRAEQETEAEELADKEMVCIEEMLNSDLGLLKSSNYSSFFREDYDHPFSMENRLNRIMNMRQTISLYVDEEKLGRDAYDPNGYNWGYLLNHWGYYISNYEKADAIELYCRFLDECGLLKDIYKNDLSSLSDFTGIWYGTGSAEDITFELWYYSDSDQICYSEIYEDESDSAYALMYQILGNTLTLTFEREEDMTTDTLKLTLTDHDHMTISSGFSSAYCVRTQEDETYEEHVDDYVNDNELETYHIDYN